MKDIDNIERVHNTNLYDKFSKFRLEEELTLDDIFDENVIVNWFMKHLKNDKK